jgi:hypothetical protein
MLVALRPIEGSTLFRAWGYEPVSRVLALQFKDSAYVYHYLDVPPEKADAFEAAPSKGTYFCQHIKHEHDSTHINTAEGDDAVAEPLLYAHAT